MPRQIDPDTQHLLDERDRGVDRDTIYHGLIRLGWSESAAAAFADDMAGDQDDA